MINHKSIKMKKILFLLLLSGSLLSCNQKNENQNQIDQGMVLFNQNAKRVHELFNALENEDLNTAASFFSEDVKFNQPAYEGKEWDKEGILQNYNGFFQLLNNIKANDRDFYPGVDAKFIPDGAVRAYVKWTADLEGNPMEGIKAYEVFVFDETNKIIQVDEYMDVSGMLNKIGALSSK